MNSTTELTELRERRLRLPAGKVLGFYVLATQMLPPVGLVIPYFLILNRVGWLDTYQGMITVYLTFSLPFAIWLMVSFMEDIPREMEAAAIGNLDHRCVRIGMRVRCVRVGRIDADVVTGKTVGQLPLCSDRPFFDMGGQPVSIC